jgi:phage baseplate assembly protein W
VARNFLGKGWKYPVELDRMGGIAISSFDDLVRQSILIIIGTAFGERVMRPHFGCEIHELVFAPNSLHTATLAADFCVQALQKWEPRIQDVEADASSSRDEPNRLDIHIKYKLRGSSTPRNLVYPFYLARSDEK